MVDLIMSEIVASFKGSVELETVVEGGLAAENLPGSTTITSKETFFLKGFFGAGFFMVVVALDPLVLLEDFQFLLANCVVLQLIRVQVKSILLCEELASVWMTSEELEKEWRQNHGECQIVQVVVGEVATKKFDMFLREASRNVVFDASNAGSCLRTLLNRVLGAIPTFLKYMK